MDGVRVQRLDLVFEGERGSNFGLRTRLRSDFLVVQRTSGTISGSHYHTGTIPEKNPEVIILVYGKAKISWKNPRSNEVHTKIIERPSKIEIQPMIWHEIEALSDITFLEEGWLKPKEYERDTRREPQLK